MYGINFLMNKKSSILTEDKEKQAKESIMLW